MRLISLLDGDTNSVNETQYRVDFPSSDLISSSCSINFYQGRIVLKSPNQHVLLINGDLDFFTPAIAVLVTVTLIDSIGSSYKQVSKHPEHTIFLRFKKKRGLE